MGKSMNFASRLAVSPVLAWFTVVQPSLADPRLPERDLRRQDISASDLARVAALTALTADFSKAEPFEAKPGGVATSTKLPDHDIFSSPSANLTVEQARDFKLGNALFDKIWVSSPFSTQASDGLGPLFNARACQSCHLKNGRGNPMEIASDASSIFLRLARPAQSGAEKADIASLKALNFPDPVYGFQIQDRAITGLKGEARMTVAYTEVAVQFKDGTSANLRKPTYSLTNLAYGPLVESVTISPRIANPMIGLGLLQAIHPADILALSDPEDADKDGISGKANLVRVAGGEIALGRFGWKAQNASLRAQTAEAFAGDIGISSPDIPVATGDCTRLQHDCLKSVPRDQDRLGSIEAPDPVLELVTFYSENLAVPARRGIDDPKVLNGKQLFYQSGCAACHTPKFVTRRDATINQHASQLIWPYSDMLLHDMGEGLADGQPVGLADGREWRTPPLWGIGLTQTVSGHTYFLHDGRARNLTEAILWHGGEGQGARDKFAAMAKADRDALLSFLESF
jgi:CxxC motif-containing protein (DUF1111 family)